MSKSKSKPKRVEYVTAASHELLMDERDLLEGALTDVEMSRDEWKAEALRLEQTICDLKSAHNLEVDNYHTAETNARSAWLEEIKASVKLLEADYLQMCEYRNDWANRAAVWEETAEDLKLKVELLAWGCDVFVVEADKNRANQSMLDAVCHALENANESLELYALSYLNRQEDIIRLSIELARANRNVFRKLWHWFTDPPWSRNRMSGEGQHELAILTNDGWVVTLISDHQIDFGDAVVSSIIVQPVEDYRKRVDAQPVIASRREYRLTRAGQAVIE